MEFEPGAGVGKRPRIDSAYPFPPLRFARHEACAFEHAEMFGHCSKREVKGLGEMADVRLARSQTIEERAAGRISKRMEDPIQIMFNHMVEYTGTRQSFNPSAKLVLRVFT